MISAKAVVVATCQSAPCVCICCYKRAVKTKNGAFFGNMANYRTFLTAILMIAASI